MKILLVSDSHGNSDKLKELVNMYPSMDYYLHAGDSGLDQITLFPYLSVKGNTDYYPFDNLLRLYTPIGYLLLKHQPNFTNEQINNNTIFIHGHTHQYLIYLDNNGKIFINPGSLILPRDNSHGSYAVLDIEKTKSSIIIYDIETKNILTNKQIR